MSLKINVKADIRGFRMDLKRLKRNVVPEAAAVALNRTNRGVRTDGVRAISHQTGIQQKRVRRRLFIPKKFLAHKGNLSTGGLSLFNYVPEIWELPAGIKVRRARQGPNKFLAKMPTGHVGFYRRKRNRRLPIGEYLIDIGLRVARIMDEVISRAAVVRWPVEFDRAMKRRLRRR